MLVSYQFPSADRMALIGLLLAMGLLLLKSRRGETPIPSKDAPAYCQGLSQEECDAIGFGALEEGRREATPTTVEALSAEEVCRSVGYLCADVTRTGELRIMRWPEETGRLLVRVPLPGHLSTAQGREFQRAAVRGIQVWHNHPFPLSITTRSQEEGADITVEWTRTLGMNRLGQTRMEWRKVGEDVQVEIPALILVTHHPDDPGLELTPDQVRLVAAHEMGHALGLPHSDDRRDLMYPQNTAWRPTVRDYLTMEAVYRMPNGALIRRP
jgi:predicted Zn-dependent protease